ncbi:MULTISPECIES: DUF418 domain-containing protein [Bacillus]|uniref:DUF418 domain-containing protein n=2 Tax=Bacillus TaxID=1386 RepID=A0A0M4FPB1_9BACI|nr:MULTISPECIES: DUF418 domain-containing protein [Bacillus]ALC80684.1 hypothetical protein AM592_03090 [Bacillus gobiensis]MBP1079574.1 uncharacterized protein [Bacillus capparidis]MED1094975.1 DUF418 domain-containing protein [Bacillus capparidis]
MNNEIQPVHAGERIVSLDILRGISILGIFLVNIFDFKEPISSTGTIISSTDTLNYWLEAFVTVFAQGSFYPLFSFLFGAGAYIIYERSVQKGFSFHAYFTRRLFALLFFGIIHILFVWHGDILLTYSVIGFLLLLFINKKPLTLLIWGAALYVPVCFTALLGLLALLVPAEELQYADPTSIQDTIRIYQDGSFWEVMALRISEWFTANALGIFFFLFLILPFMLLGIYAYKRGWFKKNWSAGIKKEIKVVMICAFVIGLPIKLLPVAAGTHISWVMLQNFIGAPIFTLFYISAALLLLHGKEAPAKGWKLFIPVGKMSITCYLSQTVFCSILFYGYGYGLYGSLSSVQLVLIVVFFYILQMLGCHIWLRKFRYGPIEWIWRKLTYWTV